VSKGEESPSVEAVARKWLMEISGSAVITCSSGWCV
jgi:hypothetical protein